MPLTNELKSTTVFSNINSFGINYLTKVDMLLNKENEVKIEDFGITSEVYTISFQIFLDRH